MKTEELKKMKKEYVQRYGATLPSEWNLLEKYENPKNFLGLTIKGESAIFSFKEKHSDSDFNVFEDHLRNRLSHKFSFCSGGKKLEALFPTCFEDYKEFFIAITDLERYFSGSNPDPRLRAEYRAIKKGLNWRDNDIIEDMLIELHNEDQQ